MKTKIRQLEGGSYVKGYLPEGCKICRKGAELFFLITGRCTENCFYCSLDGSRRGTNVILANERPVTSFSGVMLEVTNMNALGAAITGGDPLLCIDRTVEYITKMKKEFGSKFHIHLYTPGRYATEENLSKLFHAGLDEIRFHPQNKEQEKAMEKALIYSWDVGAEIPVIPTMKKDIVKFLDYLESLDGIKFCNLNELEATQTNIKLLKKQGLKLVAKDSSVIEGSETLALELLNETKYSYTLHYCSALTKDSVQFRNRLIRTAKIVRKPYEEIQDGMLVKAIKEVPKVLIAEEVLEILIQEYEVDPELLNLTEDNKIETAWYVADAIHDSIKDRFEIDDIFISYEYPTYNRILIAKAPLSELNSKLEE